MINTYFNNNNNNDNNMMMIIIIMITSYEEWSQLQDVAQQNEFLVEEDLTRLML